MHYNTNMKYLDKKILHISSYFLVLSSKEITIIVMF